MSPALTHLALHVKDIEASVAFYRTYCEMVITHDRRDHNTGQRVVWLSEPGREKEMIFVLISGGPTRPRVERDFGHLGFALTSREAVDAIAERGRSAGNLAWPARQEPDPVGYYCGLCDPDGQVVEFSYGQPLGPGTKP
jgi:catechol 2,3-dioxygenase-like lactoylglutathione lyase family enzyme